MQIKNSIRAEQILILKVKKLNQTIDLAYSKTFISYYFTTNTK
jgi:hypothetical protein